MKIKQLKWLTNMAILNKDFVFEIRKFNEGYSPLLNNLPLTWKTYKNKGGATRFCNKWYKDLIRSGIGE